MAKKDQLSWKTDQAQIRRSFFEAVSKATNEKADQLAKSSSTSVTEECLDISGHSWASEEPTITPRKRRITFQDVEHVVLIPSRSDYRKEGVHNVIWCSRTELLEFKNAAFDEIRKFMADNNCADAAKAVRMMFPVNDPEI